MNPRRTPVIIALLTVAGALAGYAAGPFLARADGTVRLAARLWQEDSQGLAERTLESDAFRWTGEPTADLLARARSTERRIGRGAVMLGAWCGLVTGLMFFSAGRLGRQDDYQIDHSRCVACGRCFRSCPREHLRLKVLAGERDDGEPSQDRGG